MSDLLERDAETSNRSRANTDAGLVRRFVRSRDEQAFEELVRRYGRLVRGVCVRTLSGNEDREDVYQATFLTLFLRAGTIRRRSNVGCWLYGVAFRIATRLRRKRKLERMDAGFDPPADLQEVWSQIDRNHLSEVLDAEMQALSTQDRLPLAMHYLMGLSHQEIGRSLGISASAVDGRLKRARQRLRTRLLSRGVGLAAALAYFGSSLRQADAAATAQAGAEAESLYSLFDGDANASPVSSNAQGLFSEEASMIASGWGKGAVVLGGATLACCGLIGIFWGGAAGSGVAQAQFGGMGGAGGMQGGGFGPAAPSADAGPVVTVRLSGERPAPQPGESKFFSPLSDPPTTRNLLANHAEVAFLDVPLLDAVEVLALQVNSVGNMLEFQIDRKALEEEAVAEDAMVNLESSHMTVADALDAMLSPMSLTYVAKERYVLITSKSRAREMTETRMYAIADHPLLRNANGNALVNAIVGHVEPDSWAITGGGYGSVSLLPGVLIVTNDQRTLDQVEDFLAQYGRLLENFQPAEDPAAGMMGMGMQGMSSMSEEGSSAGPMRGVFGTASQPPSAGGGYPGGSGYGEEGGGAVTPESKTSEAEDPAKESSEDVDGVEGTPGQGLRASGNSQGRKGADSPENGTLRGGVFSGAGGFFGGGSP